MKLMTKEIEKRLEKYPLGSQDGVENKEIICKFFYPCGNWTWFVAEGDKLENGDWEFFGYVVGDYPEWGYFTLSELESVRGWGGLGIERDKWFTPCKFNELKSYEVGVG